MLLLFDVGKKLEKAVGEEAAQIIIETFEKFSEEQKKELASKGDLRETELRLQKEIEGVRKEIESVRKEIAQSKSETIRWTVGMMVAQTAAIIAALVAIVK